MTRLASFLLMIALVACAPAMAACSANGPRGPEAVRIDPTFTGAQRRAIEDAVDAWDVQAGLTVAIVDWSDTSAIPIRRDDTLTAGGSHGPRLGATHTETEHRERDYIRLAGAGVLPNGVDVAAYDFQTTAAHELGHLFGLDGAHGDEGCDGQGHTNDPSALMYAHGTPDGKRHDITSADVERLLAVVDRAWPL